MISHVSMLSRRLEDVSEQGEWGEREKFPETSYLSPSRLAFDDCFREHAQTANMKNCNTKLGICSEFFTSCSK